MPSLVPGDSNGVTDFFVFDRLTGGNELISRSAANPGESAAGFHSSGNMTPDGRFVTFVSSSTDLVAGVTDTNGRRDTFLRDRVLGTTTLLSHLPGQPLVTAMGETRGGFPTADGRFVVLNFAPTGESSPNTWTSLYDRQTGVATLLSHAAGQPDVPANGRSSAVGLSDNGRWMLIQSGSTNLLPGGLALGHENLYLKDTKTGALVLLTGTDGLPGWGTSSPVFPTTFSRDGNTVTFFSQAANLVPG
ncbi:MAG: hypothetical protein SF066_21355, partial [Thermoanaerobaculia bacterium]|nr:hypothetical protein [Thermoanaerobaculia bacterium]